jgi:hypothetical protein
MSVCNKNTENFSKLSINTLNCIDSSTFILIEDSVIDSVNVNLVRLILSLESEVVGEHLIYATLIKSRYLWTLILVHAAATAAGTSASTTVSVATTTTATVAALVSVTLAAVATAITISAATLLVAAIAAMHLFLGLSSISVASGAISVVLATVRFTSSSLSASRTASVSVFVSQKIVTSWQRTLLNCFKHIKLK